MSADQPVLLVVKQAITTGSLEGVVEQALIAVASLQRLAMETPTAQVHLLV